MICQGTDIPADSRGLDHNLFSVDGIKIFPNTLSLSHGSPWSNAERGRLTWASRVRLRKPQASSKKRVTSTASLRKAKQKHGKVVICATKAGSKMARRRRQP